MRKQRGTSAVEMMVVVLVFTLLAGAAFRLLNVSQQRYRMESDVLDSFQAAQVALDQMARDIHTSGYPPVNSYTPAAAVTQFTKVACAPFAWSPGYPAADCTTKAPCTVGAGCTTPNGFDLIVETDFGNGNGVQWIRYQLNGTTLFRGVAAKQAGADPAVVTQPTLVPYVDNVMNNASAAQIAQIQKSYPGMFPGGAPVPVFTYKYDSGQPNTPPNIREVNLTLIVQAQTLDPLTQQPRVVTLTARARRINPNQ